MALWAPSLRSKSLQSGFVCRLKLRAVLQEDGRKLFAGTIAAADPRELVLKWSGFLAAAERGTYFATYRGSFVVPEPALEYDAVTLAA